MIVILQMELLNCWHFKSYFQWRIRHLAIFTRVSSLASQSSIHFCWVVKIALKRLVLVVYGLLLCFDYQLDFLFDRLKSYWLSQNLSRQSSHQILLTLYCFEEGFEFQVNSADLYYGYLPFGYYADSFGNSHGRFNWYIQLLNNTLNLTNFIFLHSVYFELG